MREPTEGIRRLPAQRRPDRRIAMKMATPMRAGHMGRLDDPSRTLAHHHPDTYDHVTEAQVGSPSDGSKSAASGSLGSASALAAASASAGLILATGAHARPMRAGDPDVWLIALPQPNGELRSLEGAGRAGAIRVSRPYGHLRSIRPVVPTPIYGVREDSSYTSAGSPVTGGGRWQATKRSGELVGTVAAKSGSLGSAAAPGSSRTSLPAQRPLPQVITAVEVETDAGLFRVERTGGVLSHGDMGWALAHLDPGEPDSQVPVSRRQLALLLTLLPTPDDPNVPEQDPLWGWAHKLRGPWERGPLHLRGRLGRLIAFDPDDSGKGMHRACFELLGTEEIVWAIGVPCFRTGSVYELVPIGKGLHPSRWLTWPLTKGRRRSGAMNQPPTWEIARIVYRVGAPRWPLAGVIEPLGPLGIAG
jgi:hypothetical protein